MIEMRMINFTFDESVLNKKLGNMNKSFNNMEPVMQGIQAEMVADVNQHFERERGDQGKWVPLAPSTLMKRRKMGKGGKILQDTGRLKGSVLRVGRLKQGESLNQYDRESSTIGTTLEYAPKHQFGSGHIPARPFLWLSDIALKNIRLMIFDFINKAWNK